MANRAQTKRIEELELEVTETNAALAAQLENSARQERIISNLKEDVARITEDLKFSQKSALEIMLERSNMHQSLDAVGVSRAVPQLHARFAAFLHSLNTMI